LILYVCFSVFSSVNQLSILQTKEQNRGVVQWRAKLPQVVAADLFGASKGWRLRGGVDCGVYSQPDEVKLFLDFEGEGLSGQSARLRANLAELSELILC
jgi:hypothetical protein